MNHAQKILGLLATLLGVTVELNAIPLPVTIRTLVGGNYFLADFDSDQGIEELIEQLSQRDLQPRDRDHILRGDTPDHSRHFVWHGLSINTNNEFMAIKQLYLHPTTFTFIAHAFTIYETNGRELHVVEEYVATLRIPADSREALINFFQMLATHRPMEYGLHFRNINPQDTTFHLLWRGQMARAPHAAAHPLAEQEQHGVVIMHGQPLLLPEPPQPEIFRQRAQQTEHAPEPDRALDSGTPATSLAGIGD